jgi:hypothetical protein
MAARTIGCGCCSSASITWDQWSSAMRQQSPARAPAAPASGSPAWVGRRELAQRREELLADRLGVLAIGIWTVNGEGTVPPSIRSMMKNGRSSSAALLSRAMAWGTGRGRGTTAKGQVFQLRSVSIRLPVGSRRRISARLPADDRRRSDRSRGWPRRGCATG